MIKVTNNNKIDMIVISGHAMYDDYGKDIVCSAVSSIVITTVNGIHRLNDNYLIVEQEKDLLTIKINKEDKTCYILIENLLDLLNELEEQYPENIKIK